MSRISRQAARGASSRQTPKTTEHPLKEQLISALEKDEDLVVLASSLATHALPASDNRLAELTETIAKRFPARFYGLGELLADLVPTVTRLALSGKHPLVLIGSADLARSYAGLSALCAQHLGVIFLLLAGHTPGQTWRSPQANDLAILRTLSQLYISSPSSLEELTSQLHEARQVEDNPIAIYYGLPEAISPPTRSPTVRLVGRPFGLGKSAMLREGKNLALLSFGPTYTTAMSLATRLQTSGLQAAVVDVRWVRPLDEPLLTAVAHHFPRLVTLEEGGLEGGFGSAVLELLERRGLYETRVKRLELGRRPNLAKLAESVTAFLDTLQRDERLVSPLSHYLAAHSSG
jgi:1-deoxy-D-xylulose-5-phosphate synthase